MAPSMPCCMRRKWAICCSSWAESCATKVLSRGPLRELAILVVGRHFEADYEWWAHAAVGSKEGLSDDTIDRVMNQQMPQDTAEATVYRFVSDLQTKKRIDDATYKAALDLLGAEGVTELVFLAGYYATISHILNAFEVGLPSGQAPIFKG